MAPFPRTRPFWAAFLASLLPSVASPACLLATRAPLASGPIRRS